ncbi:MAG: hypothetical protein JXX14_21575 [Deltaproteobacteria bacterium]|nr:hypothetical protein [Deltaproteobacteria bacterium]
MKTNKSYSVALSIVWTIFSGMMCACSTEQGVPDAALSTDNRNVDTTEPTNPGTTSTGDDSDGTLNSGTATNASTDSGSENPVDSDSDSMQTGNPDSDSEQHTNTIDTDNGAAYRYAFNSPIAITEESVVKFDLITPSFADYLGSDAQDFYLIETQQELDTFQMILAGNTYGEEYYEATDFGIEENYFETGVLLIHPKATFGGAIENLSVSVENNSIIVSYDWEDAMADCYCYNLLVIQIGTQTGTSTTPMMDTETESDTNVGNDSDTNVGNDSDTNVGNDSDTNASTDSDSDSEQQTFQTDTDSRPLHRYEFTSPFAISTDSIVKYATIQPVYEYYFMENQSEFHLLETQVDYDAFQIDMAGDFYGDEYYEALDFGIDANYFDTGVLLIHPKATFGGAIENLSVSVENNKVVVEYNLEDGMADCYCYELLTIYIRK